MKLKKIAITLIIFLLSTVLLNINKVEAVELPENLENITSQDILEIYDQITEEYTNEEIADMILENKEQISEEAGVNETTIEAGAEFLRNTSQNEIRNILENDENVNEIIGKIQQGDNPDDAIATTINNTSTTQIIGLVFKILLANTIVKTILWAILILFIYCTIMRWIIYNKAGKNGFAAIIPFYRQVTMYKICGLSPFLMIFWLIPVFGWIVMLVIAIMKRFLLAQNFGKGALFGLELLIFPPIFQSVLAFNDNIKYEK